MATIKSYSDLQQSKKLAEILPLKSADMVYIKHSSSTNLNWEFNEDFPPMILGDVPINEMTVETLPCWSLAALLDVLPDSIYDNTDEFSQLEFTKKSVAYIQGTTNGIKIGALKDNLVDACYEMIIKIKQSNLI